MGGNNVKTLTILLTLALASVAHAAGEKVFDVGQPATIALVSVSGTAPFTYQWKRNGTDIAGANSPQYVIPSVATSHAGSYTVVVTNSAGSTRSDTALLIVRVPPADAVAGFPPVPTGSATSPR